MMEDLVKGALDSAEVLPSNKGMVRIPGGSFQMGSEAGGEFERPIHEVRLDSFFLDETPVTNLEFRSFTDATGYITEVERNGAAWGYKDNRFHLVPGLSWRAFALSERDHHPVLLVSWFDAIEYANWRGKRLPTEAEWEIAACGGAERNRYPWGNSPPSSQTCNFGRNPEETPPTTPVKQFPPNPHGLYDLVGNVWQWCFDWYSPTFYSEGVQVNPAGPVTGEVRVRRGGSWNVIQPFRLRTSNRGAFQPHAAAPNVGFRCALSEIGLKHKIDSVARGQEQVSSVSAQPQEGSSSVSTSSVAEVEAVLGSIRPAMRADGGDVQVAGLQGKTVFVRLEGTCLSCPSASLTLKHGIERALKDKLQWVEEVRRVD